jgi:hypothetical protein
MRAATLLAGCMLVAAACSEPRVAEDRAAACANRIDDDGDGLVDCDDPDCAGTEACERTATTCANDLDDDRDGTLDCRQATCRALPVCRDAEPKDCFLLPPGSVNGCQRGKGCYLADSRKWCALEGPSLAGGACGTDPSDRSQGCAAGYQCGSDRRCARICVDDYDCTRNSICLDRDRELGTCTLSCLRSSDCRSGEACAALQREDFSLEQGGWAHRCVAESEIAQGTASEGQPCVDPAARRGGADVCGLGLLCLPDPDGKRCREVCRGSTDGRPTGGGCPSGRLCHAIVPFSGQGSSFDEPYAIGVCL